METPSSVPLLVPELVHHVPGRSYEEELALKENFVRKMLPEVAVGDKVLTIFASPTRHFRFRTALTVLSDEQIKAISREARGRRFLERLVEGRGAEVAGEEVGGSEKPSGETPRSSSEVVENFKSVERELQGLRKSHFVLFPWEGELLVRATLPERVSLATLSAGICELIGEGESKIPNKARIFLQFVREDIIPWARANAAELACVRLHSTMKLEKECRADHSASDHTSSATELSDDNDKDCPTTTTAQVSDDDDVCRAVSFIFKGFDGRESRDHFFPPLQNLAAAFPGTRFVAQAKNRCVAVLCCGTGRTTARSSTGSMGSTTTTWSTWNEGDAVKTSSDGFLGGPHSRGDLHARGASPIQQVASPASTPADSSSSDHGDPDDTGPPDLLVPSPQEEVSSVPARGSAMPAAQELMPTTLLKKLPAGFGAQQVLKSCSLTEELIVDCRGVHPRRCRYQQIVDSFSNPNPHIAVSTAQWLAKMVRQTTPRPNLLELYCGVGSHTVALAPAFAHVVAVEIDPNLVEMLQANVGANKSTGLRLGTTPGGERAVVPEGVVDVVPKIARTETDVEDQSTTLRTTTTTIFPIRAPSEYFCKKIMKQKRWRDIAFDWVLVDPPRAGLDSVTLGLIQHFENVLYISCNVGALRRNLDILCGEKGPLELVETCLLDHFPFTPHVEVGVYLRRRGGRE